VEDFWKALLLGLAAPDHESGCSLIAMALGLIGVFFFVGLLTYTAVAG
jgi:hypothetical protein